MGTFKATRFNGDEHLFESSSLEQAKADAWDSKVVELSDADITKMEKAAKHGDAANDEEGMHAVALPSKEDRKGDS
jgi:hypothetical protein